MSTIISRFAPDWLHYPFLSYPSEPEILAQTNISRSRKSRLFHNLRRHSLSFFRHAYPSRINASHPGVVGDAVNGQHIGRSPRVHGMRVGIAAEVVKAGHHRVLKPFVDYALSPEITHSVLHPFEVRNSHAAGIRKDVGDYEDSLLVQNLVRRRGCWSISSFGQHLALQSPGIVRRDLIFSRRRNQHVAIQFQQFRVADVFRTLVALKRARRLQILQSRGDVDAFRVVNAATHVGYAGYFKACFVKQQCRDAADVPAPLHDHPSIARSHLESLGGFIYDDQQSSTGRFAPPSRAAEIDWLAGYYSIHRVSRMHGIRVHDPRHRLLVCIHVRSRHILLWPDEIKQLGRVAARHSFQLTERHLQRVTDDAALCAAERHVNDG